MLALDGRIILYFFCLIFLYVVDKKRYRAIFQHIIPAKRPETSPFLFGLTAERVDRINRHQN